MHSYVIPTVRKRENENYNTCENMEILPAKVRLKDGVHHDD